MLDFEVLASSSAGCAYRLSGGGAAAPLLLEAGLRFEDIRRGLGFRVSELAGCLVTHAHGDHSKAIVDVAKAGIDVYASRETFAACPGVPKHRQQVVEAEEEFVVGDWIVMPFATVHDSPGSLGFLIGSPKGHRLLFLTDSAYSPKTFEGLTHVAAEANFSEEILRANAAAGHLDAARYKRVNSTHLSIERLVEMLRANDLSRVEEIHLLHLSSSNSDEAAFKRLIEREFGIPCFVAAERTLGRVG